MPCPWCGGARRTELAPGYYECRSEVTIAITPDGIPVPDLCEKKYQEGPGVGKLCFCRTAAVRFCKECDEPLCGEHGVLYPQNSDDGTWHCKSCRDDKKARIDAEIAAEVEGQRRAYAELPPIGREQLERWIAGQLPHKAFRDGVTHRADDWTCADVAQLLCELLGEPGYDYIVRGRDGDTTKESGYGRQRREIGDPTPKLPAEPGALPENPRRPRKRTVGDTVLTHDGRLMSIQDGYDYNGNHPRADKRLRSASDPLSAFLDIDDALLSFSQSALNQVRNSFAYNKMNVNRLRLERIDREKELRNDRLKSLAWLILLGVVVLLVVWLLAY